MAQSLVASRLAVRQVRLCPRSPPERRDGHDALRVQAAAMLDAQHPGAPSMCALAKRLSTDACFEVGAHVTRRNKRDTHDATRCAGVQQSAANARRLRVPSGLPPRAVRKGHVLRWSNERVTRMTPRQVCSRLQSSPNLGGHERGHAADSESLPPRCPAGDGVTVNLASGLSSLTRKFVSDRDTKYSILPFCRMRCSCRIRIGLIL